MADKRFKNNIYTNILITRKVNVNIVNIGKNIKEIIKNHIENEIEGKCIVEGYIKKKSINILTYSSGILNNDNILFNVTFECMVCFPIQGMKIKCVAKNITKAGIRAEINDEDNPLVIFISRDHHYKSKYFSKVKENDNIIINVIGQRYELNDTFVSVIAELVEPKKKKIKIIK